MPRFDIFVIVVNPIKNIYKDKAQKGSIEQEQMRGHFKENDFIFYGFTTFFSP